MSPSPDQPAHRSGTDLGAHFSLLRRRWLLFVGFVLAGGTAGLALLRVTPPAYTATTQILVAPVGVQEQGNQVTSRVREPLNLDTEAQIAQSAVVAAGAAKALGTPTLEPVEVSVPPNSAVLWISVTAPDPGSAAAQSRAYADAYLANRLDSAKSTMAAQQKVMLGKLKQVNTALDKVVNELGGLPKGTPEHTIAVHRMNVLNRQAYSLTMKYDALKTVTVTPGSIISQATPPDAPSSPSLPLYLGTGLMTGLFLGSAAAYARDRLDTRLRAAADVERLLGLVVLADLSTARAAPHDLAAAVLADCPGRRLLIRTVPPGLNPSIVSAPLSATTPLTLLNGSDAGELARADAALLLVDLHQADAHQVVAAVRHLHRHNVPVIGAVTAADMSPAPVLAREPRVHTSLGKLVAGGDPDTAMTAETTPMQALPQPPGKPT